MEITSTSIHLGRGSDLRRLRRNGITLRRSSAASVLLDAQADGARFIFRADSTYGARLDTFERTGGHQWTNRQPVLWQAIIWKAGVGRDAHDANLLLPKQKHFTGVRQVGTNRWDFEWVGITIESSQLNVTFHVELHDDWLEYWVTAKWTTTSAWTITGLRPLPLRVTPHDQPNDMAFGGILKGIAVYDPIFRFRHARHESGQLITGFIAQSRNQLDLASGKQLSQPLFGYGSTSDRESWMGWMDDDQDWVTRFYFQSDSQTMALEVSVHQKDWLIAGNGGHSVTTGGTFGLRPYLAVSQYVWHDAAKFYLQRKAARNTPWLVTKHAADTDRPSIERKPWLWVHGDVAGIQGDVDTKAIMDATLAHIRENLGLGHIPIIGMLNTDDDRTVGYAPHAPADPTDTTREFIRDAARDGSYFGIHKAAVWSISPRWHWGSPRTTVTPETADPWEDFDLQKLQRTKPQGYIDGDADEHRGTSGETEVGYYTEEAVKIVGYDPSTLTVTVQAPIAADWGKSGGLNQATHLTFKKADGTWARSFVKTKIFAGDTTIELLELPVDKNHETTPVFVPTNPDDSVAYLHEVESGWCHHALVNGDAAQLMAEMSHGLAKRNFLAFTHYIDVYPARGHRNDPYCSTKTHSGPMHGGSQHPQGGGDSWIDSTRRMFALQHQAAQSVANPPFSFLMAEYLDERYFDSGMFIGLHAATMHRLWRSVRNGSNDPNFTEPDDHRIVSIPLFATCHSGRALGLHWRFEFGNGLLDPLARNDTALGPDAQIIRRQVALWAFGEWPYGFTPLSFLVNSYNGNLWDPDEYTGPDAADPEVADIRDLWAELVKAEFRWLWILMRTGQLEAPGDLHASTTRFDAIAYGWFDFAFGIDLSTRSNGTSIYEPRNFPRVVHAFWRTTSGAVVLVMVNPTSSNGTLRVQGELSRWGLPSRVDRFTVSAEGSLTPMSSVSGTYDESIFVEAYSAAYRLLVPPQDAPSTPIEQVTAPVNLTEEQVAAD